MSNRRRIDVDAARVARAEERGDDDPIILVLEGVEYRLPDELPLDALEVIGPLLSSGDATQAKSVLAALLDGVVDLDTVKLSLSDFELIAYGVLDAYGITNKDGKPDPSTASPAT